MDVTKDLLRTCKNDWCLKYSKKASYGSKWRRSSVSKVEAQIIRKDFEKIACDSYKIIETKAKNKGIPLPESVFDHCGICFGDGSSCPRKGSVMHRCVARGSGEVSLLTQISDDKVQRAISYFKPECDHNILKIGGKGFGRPIEFQARYTNESISALVISTGGSSVIVYSHDKATKVTDSSKRLHIKSSSVDTVVRLFSSAIVTTILKVNKKIVEIRIDIDDTFTSSVSGRCVGDMDTLLSQSSFEENILCSPSPAVSSCTDKKKNGDEIGIDCGGSCARKCPSCSDGERNGKEEGVDCGGDCVPCST